MTVENISIDVKTNAGSAAKQFRSLSSAISGVTSAAKSVGGNRSGSTAHSVKSVGSAAKSATGAMGKLFASIKRIAFYRLLRTFIKELSQAFQEGLKNVYAFSKAMNTGMAQALDRIASASAQMKNQMGAALGELLYTIEPIINAIIGMVTTLMNALSALFAALGGRFTYTVADKTADSWDKATGAAKEYKNTVLGFDEINRLNDKTGGGGGSVNINGIAEISLPDWAEQIREAIERDSWEDVGAAIGRKINEIFSDDSVFKTAGETIGKKVNGIVTAIYYALSTIDFTEIGGKISSLINSGLNKNDAKTWGRTLVKVFATAFDFFIGLLTKINWSQVGQKIGDFLSGAIQEASNWLKSKDWEEVANSLFTGAIDMINGINYESLASDFFNLLGYALDAISKFLNNTNWEGISSNMLSNMNRIINSIDFGALAEKFFNLLGNAFNATSKFLSGIDWENLGSNMFTNMDRILNSIDFDQLAESFFNALGTAFGAAASFLWGMIKKAWEKIVEWWHELAYEDGKFTFQGLLDGIVWWIDGIVQWVDVHVVQPFVGAFCKLLGINSPSTVFYEIGENIVAGLSNGFKSAWDTFFFNVQTWWNNLKTWFNGLSLNLNLRGTTVNADGLSHGIGHFATGGMPEVGSLFVAGEAGAELVTNMGNGRTGVTNVEQMEAAVANGNINVVNAVYAMANAVVKAVNDKDTNIILDGQSLADKMYRYNQQAANRYGMAMVT